MLDFLLKPVFSLLAVPDLKFKRPSWLVQPSAKGETSVEKAIELRTTAKKKKATAEIFSCQKYFITGQECGFECGDGCK